MTEKEWDNAVGQIATMKEPAQGVGTLIDIFTDISTSLAHQLPESDAKQNLLRFYSNARDRRKDLIEAVVQSPAHKKRKAK